MPNEMTVEQQIQMEEWKECRTTVDRFDKIIADLRKFGFTLITSLVTAQTFLFVKQPDLSLEGKAALSGLMMLLTYALFVIDRYHEVLLQATVERAIVLEQALGIPEGLSKVISDRVAARSMDTWGRDLYSLFLFACFAFPLIAADLFSLTGVQRHWPLLLLMIAILIFFWTSLYRTNEKNGR